MRDDTELKVDSKPASISVGFQDESTSGRFTYWLALIQALLATSVLEIGAGDADQSTRIIVLTLAFEMSIVLVGGLMAHQWDIGAGVSSRPRLIWIVSLAIGTFFIEVAARSSANAMLPLELLLLAGFRNATLALAIFAHRQDCQRMCCSLSTFLIIFASTLASQLWVLLLVVVFAIIGIWWLMNTYWQSLKGHLTGNSEREMSRRWLIGIPLIVLLALIGLPVAGSQTHALRGFMPSSGGTQWYDENARSGVGDGDNLVAGTENIQSFAPIDDAPFLSSHEPSLYDLFDDAYDEPVKPRQSDRAIALDSKLASKQKERHLATSEQNGKQFSTIRKSSDTKSRKVGDRDSSALLYVKGRVPVHLKLEVFDQYDGVNWRAEPLAANHSQLTMQTVQGLPWLQIPSLKALEVFASPETHALRIIHLDTNRVPAPTQLLGIHIDRLDRADFYKWAQPGVVQMDRDKLPALTVMHIQSRCIDERKILHSLAHFSGGSAIYRQVFDGADSDVEELAREWTRNAAPGWPQVQSIVERLRQDYVHDRDVRAPEDCEHTVGHFLFESRRGPDYLFASTVVQMLRSLGFSARLASGFYANPARYDRRGGQTPVLPEDVHFWAEVNAGNENWLPVEATPGYDLLLPPPTTIEQLQAAALATWRFAWRNAPTLLLAVAALMGAGVRRRFIADGIRTLFWRLFPARNERERVLQTLRLLDHRCCRSARSRPHGVSPTRWLAQVTVHQPDHQVLLKFARLADWASFAPNQTLAPCGRPADVCREAVRVWSLRRFIAIAKKAPASKLFIAQPPLNHRNAITA
ncbi:MAG: transglutaminase domain protein [Schlesneria sp.]|nr:transglutaminase domain protein [Schlesneria sp.]